MTCKPDNCVCWHCCHAYDGDGFRLPRIFDPSENVYHVYGWYCSANCAKAYVLEHSTFDRGYQMNIFVRMLRDVYGISEGINEAPPRLSLKMFGGPFDIETFRTQKNVCLSITPPFVSYCMLVEERTPIGNIGETTHTNANRGSVRGLRRPTEQRAPLPSEDICAPDTEGMYSAFVNSMKPVETDNSEPPTKKARVARRAAAPTGGGLAKFACGSSSSGTSK